MIKTPMLPQLTLYNDCLDHVHNTMSNDLKYSYCYLRC